MKHILLYFILIPLLTFGSPKINGIPSKYLALVETAIQKAGSNSKQIEDVLKKVGKKDRKAAAFLISYMPENDLKTLTSDFILDQINGAAKVRKEFKWCRNLPDSVYLNEVLPYFTLDEKRDNWRNDFYNRFAPYVRNCKTIYEAIDSVNLNIRDELQVDYNTKRSIVNISPFKAIEEKMATCTGLSFLLVDALRSVGIPARMAGTPMWTNMRGNHNWVEVWINGQWYFTEYYPDKLNKSWFLADAGKADPQKPVHWIYASSYKPGDTHFIRVWKRDAKDINAWNVTDRYIKLYENQLAAENLKPDETWVKAVLYKSGGNEAADNRISKKIVIKLGDKQVDFGFSPLPTDDLNRFLKFRLKKNSNYSIEFEGIDGAMKKQELKTIDNGEIVVKLF